MCSVIKPNNDSLIPTATLDFLYYSKSYNNSNNSLSFYIIHHDTVDTLIPPRKGKRGSSDPLSSSVGPSA